MDHEPSRAATAPVARKEPATGATALGTAAHSRHVVGNALRAVRVFGGTAFSVVVLGRCDPEPATLPVPHPRRQDRDAA
jgi:hypothetical protein